MTRALWLFALFAAFLVAGARCLSAFSAGEETQGVAMSQGSHAPSQDGSATGGTIGDDSDDGMDALMAPSPVSFALVAAPLAGSGTQLAHSRSRALRSHALGLDRPPRV